MWLQLELVLVCLVLCLSVGKVSAQELQDPQASSGLRIYADDDRVTVVSPSATILFSPWETVEVDLASTIDVVSAASVDVITQASPSHVHDVRVEGSGAVRYSLAPTLRLQGSGIVSHEKDYDAARAGIGAPMEVAGRNAIIDLMYTMAFDQAGSSVDAMFSESRRGHIVAGAFTQILDTRTYLDVLADLRRFDGYHASPYRRVPIVGFGTTELFVVDEQTPARRDSAAASLRIRRAPAASRWFLHAAYRLYGDDWSIVSHTFDVQLLRSLAGERFLLGVNLRGYRQSAADFFEGYYQVAEDASLPRYRTRDRSLGAMGSLHAEVTFDAALGHDTARGWRLRTTLAGTHFRFDDFPAQRQRNALSLGLSLLAPL